MFDRLKNFLNLQSEATATPNQLDLVIEELESGIQSVKDQLIKITDQESNILQRLQGYQHQQYDKIQRAKQALRNKNELLAESYYKESEILNRQIDQYQRIAREVQETKTKLLAQENQFLLTKDELSAKKMLGEANVDASQLKADMSEQLMFLNESNELTQFDELIQEASYKSQAIQEIQGSENSFDDYLEQNRSALDKLEHIVHEEKEQKIKASLRNQQVLIERVFGSTEPTVDSVQKEKQGSLLAELKEKDTSEEKTDRINNFFKSSEEEQVKQNSAQEITKDKEDRVRNFFK